MTSALRTMRAQSAYLNELETTTKKQVVMTAKDLNEYLGALDKAANIYKVRVSFGEVEFKKELDLLDKMAIKAINKYHNG